MKAFSVVFVVLYRLFSVIVRIVYPVRIEGLEHLPEHGALLCPNHSSNWDPILLVVKLPIDYRLRIMAKEELFRFPPLGWILSRCGAFPVKRGSMDIQSVKTAMQAVKDGENLLIFPEGTVIRNGIGRTDGLPAHAHSGVAVIGVRTGATMVPVFIEGEKRVFRKTRIIIGEPYAPVYSGRRGTSEEMQRIADDLLEKAYALGGQAVGGKAL